MILLLSALSAAQPALQTGRFGAELWVTSATKTPILGEIEGQSVSWLLITITEEDGQLWQEQTTCSVQLLDAFGKARASFPPGFIEALPGKRYPLRTDAGYFADIGVDHIGYDPAWPLPTTADDPGVLDFDHDGQPGATVRLDIPILGEAEMYIVQRAHMMLTGTITSPRHVHGGLAMPLFEQNTLGATSRFLDRSPPVRPLPDQSGFAMVALPEETDCARLPAALCEAGVAREESCRRLPGD